MLALMLSGLWALAVVSILLPVPEISFVAAGGLAAYLLPSIFLARPTTLLVAGILLTASFVTALTYDALGSLWLGLERSILFTAFLPTLSLLRASVRGDARLNAYRERVDRVEPAARPAWIVSGGFVIASVLSVGASAVFAPLMRADAPEGERIAQARWNICGSSLAIIWSPFFVGLAVVSDFLPDVHLAALVAAGAATGVAGMLLAVKIYAPKQRLRMTGHALRALTAFAPPILLITALVVAIRGWTALSTIETMLLILPLLCAARLMLEPGDALRPAIGDVWTGMLRMRDDIIVVSAAMMFGTVLTTTPWMNDLSLVELLAGSHEGLLVLATIVVMATLGVLGVQPLVAGTLCLVVLTGLDLSLSDLAIGLTVLIGWSASSMLSLSSLLVRVTAGQYGVLPERLIIGRNMVFFLAFLPLSLGMVWIVNNLTAAAGEIFSSPNWYDRYTVRAVWGASAPLPPTRIT